MTESTPALRLLVVEDDPLDAELILDELRADGLVFEARVVDDEPRFRENLSVFAPDIVLSDLSMPGFSGYRALQILRDEAPRTPFIFVSGTIGEDAAIEALRSGATDYILKGRLARMASAVRRALREADDAVARDRAESELLRAQRFESLAMLAGGLSHDLRNILQPLLLTAPMIAASDDAELRKHGELVGDCARRGLEMVASMLSFARGARVEIERVRLAALFDALAMLLRGSVPRNVTLVFEKPDEELLLEGNQTELQQCLLNLCLNALQAMPDGGTLTLSAVAAQLEGDFFGEDESPVPGAYLRLEVRDTGMGMSEDVRRSLFRPFFTTKSDGTGLGLLSCKRIVTNHRGYLRVASEVGTGTTFTLYLPLATVEGAPENAALPRGRGERILVVAEKAGKLTMLFDCLDLNGYSATTAQSGTEALQKIDATGIPQLLVMDADLNQMTGVRTMAALLERGFSGPMILLVRPDRPVDRDGLPPVERIRFVDKPVSVPALLRAVREELDAVAGD
ncbi:hybrid sensor histidine kinase/response regulator [Dokdonella koreensis]|uniref:histidine kinase n=1 Tax=Dokdonella koreensis DS-123 TaxID=1300342 RepID=A0A167G9Y4_9GAMM|nr:response regulator [Dokdonella koreensis]ANB16318.1 Signal transduction histidine kinase [Dokdonella koreensis DS-123]